MKPEDTAALKALEKVLSQNYTQREWTVAGLSATIRRGIYLVATGQLIAGRSKVILYEAFIKNDGTASVCVDFIILRDPSCGTKAWRVKKDNNGSISLEEIRLDVLELELMYNSAHE